MWIYPTSIASSTLVQMFGTPPNVWSCTNLLDIYSPAGSIGQLFVMSNSNMPLLIIGRFLIIIPLLPVINQRIIIVI